MGYIGTRNKIAAGGTVKLEPFTTGTQAIENGTLGRNETEVIAAGQYKTVVYNDGLTTITVNGDDLPTGNTVTFEARTNQATQRVDLTPEVTIVTPDTEGASASFSYISPSS